MGINIKKISPAYLILILLLIFAIGFLLLIKNDKKKKSEALAAQPILINLLTSVHPNLQWNFQPINSKITVSPGEVSTIEYMVENFGNTETTGIATFSYYPRDFGNYISKINCFCYDAQTLDPKQKSKYTLIFLIDPEVTKDSKTKSIKEVTIQFTFFDYKEYKANKN